MKWFKHDTNARNDLRVKLLKKRFGLEGYGTYFSLLEIIGEFVEKDNLDEWGYVDKLHTTETLAEEIGTTPEKLDEIFQYCNELGLFTQKNKRLYCEKILTRLDEYADKIRKTTDSIGTKSGESPKKVPLEEEREEEKNKKENIYSTQKYLLGIPGIDLQDFTDKFVCTEKQVIAKGESLYNYCKSKGKVYKDYKAFLRNALEKDYGLRPTTSLVNGADYVAQKEAELEAETHSVAELKSSPLYAKIGKTI